VVALAVSSRRARPRGQTLARFIAGPIATTATAAAALAWAWEGPAAAVDRLAPLFAVASVVVGIVAGVLAARSPRSQAVLLPRR
jgi:hypothetical protein